MKITEITKDDAIHMADLLALITHTNKLIDAMKVAGIQMQGRAVEKKETTFAWIKEVATGMAHELAASVPAPPPPKPSQPAPGMKSIKSPTKKKAK